MNTSAAPRPASTVILLKEPSQPAAQVPAEFQAENQIYMVKRHHRSGFMAGAHVFPGGRVDEADKTLGAKLPTKVQEELATQCDGVDDVAEAVAFAVAAIRETAEECGLLLCRNAAGEVPTAQVADRVFASLREGGAFADQLAKEELFLDVQALAPFAWWLTPDAEPKRYDTRFFLAKAPAKQNAAPDLHETTQGDWFTPSAALQAYQEGQIALAPPTLATLEDLRRLATFADAAASVARPLRCICPLITTEDDQMVLALPGDPLHSASQPSDRVFSQRTRFIMTSPGHFASA